MENPLRQYFRRPALYLRLPSGGNFYTEESVDLPDNKEIPIYPMTAVDEITSKTPDALYNGTAVVEIIRSCAPNIKDPWAIPSSDLDSLLLGIRVATQGNDMDVESICPKCSTEGSYSINLSGLINSFPQINYDEKLKLNELNFSFRPISYKKINDLNLAQFELSKKIANIESITDSDQQMKESTETVKKLNELSMVLMAESIEKVETPSDVVTEKEHIMDFLRNCDKNTFEQLKKYSISLRERSQLKPLQVKCSNCAHEYEQNLTINITDFFD